MKEFILQPVADFSAYLEGRKVVGIGVGPDREVLLLAVVSGLTDERFAAYTQPGWIVLKRHNNPVTPTLLEFHPDYIGEIEMNQMEAKQLSYVQPLPNGEFLLVGGRYEGDVPNAVVFSAAGVHQRDLILRDGIADVQVAQDSTIWVSYFDEGVFSFDPLTATGLLRFSSNGEIIWRFEARSGFNSISDCYAMDVGREATWICYYTNFPIVRIKADGTMRGWKNKFTGARALAIDNHRVLLFGGYELHRSRCVVQEFGDEKMLRAREIQLLLPDAELPARMRVVGRGSTLHFFIGTVWYQFDLAEVDA